MDITKFNNLLIGQCCTYYSKKNICINAGNILKDALNNGENVDDNLIENYLNYVDKSHNSYIRNNCLSCNTNQLLPILKIIYQKYKPKFDHLERLITAKLADLINHILENHNYQFTSKQINKIYPLVDKIHLLFRNYKYDNDFKILLFIKNNSIHQELSSIIDKSSADIKYTTEMLDTVCKTMPFSNMSLYSLLGKGLKLDHTCVISSCTTKDIESIKLILKLSDINVNDICDICEDSPCDKLSTLGGKMIEKYIRHSYNPSHEIIPLLCDNGYTLTGDDIIVTLYKHIQIPSFEKYYKIPLTKNFLDVCRSEKFYPHYKFDCISENMMELYRKVTTQQYVGTKKFIKEHNLIPDDHCFQIVSDTKMLSIFIDAGGKVPFNCTASTGYNSSFSKALFLRPHFKKNYDEMIKRVKLLEEENKELEIKNKKIKELKLKIKRLTYGFIDFTNLDKPQCDRPRKKVPITTIYKELFEPKQEKISYLEIKKELLKAIVINKWQDTINDQIVIDLPTSILDKLNLSKGYIKEKDIDYIVQKLYQ